MGELGDPGLWRLRRSLPTSILSRRRENGRRENMSKAALVAPGPQEQQTHLVPALSHDGMRCIHSDLCGGVTEAADGVAVGLRQGAVRVPCLVLGSGLLSFFGSGVVSALCIRNVGPVPQLWKGANLPHSSGLSCSFIWGFLPWAWCPDPKEAPACLATAGASLSCPPGPALSAP